MINFSKLVLFTHCLVFGIYLWMAIDSGARGNWQVFYLSLSIVGYAGLAVSDQHKRAYPRQS